MIIDYASRPPLAEFVHEGKHLKPYSRVYAQSYAAARRDELGPDALAEYIATYDRVGARHVLIRGRDAESTYGIRVPNEVVADFCRRHAPRFIGLAGVDPHKGIRAIRDLEHAIKGLGLSGLSLSPFEHKLRINDPKMYPLYAKCIELDIPLNLHCSTSFSAEAFMDCGHPRYLDEVMVHFPELRVCASPPGFPWIFELIACAWRHANVYIGVTAVRPRYLTTENSGYGPLLQYGNTVLKDRMIWGSAFPMQPVERTLEELQALPFKDGVQQKWLYENCARFLRLGEQG
ncbi:MAG: amidohydrolase family protein [Alphaproteobacteria bacterium]|nr:amidohydrolase family protein [Alphaproteobacteria bacterium]